MELIGTDIDRIDMDCSPLEENLGESPSRGTDIETLCA
jgi:hypothetical protein